MKWIVCALALCACSESEGRFPVVVSTVSDDGPIAGVTVTLGKAVAGKTGADGKLSVNVRGKEGTKVTVSTDVPKGYKLAPGGATALVLRRLTEVEGSDGKAHLLPVEHLVKFVPLVRQYAVLVRVGVPGLDVETFGTRQAVTNSRGVAMFLYQGAPGDELQVKVDTSSHPELRPQNPTANFLLGPRSEAYVVKEKFGTFKKAAPKAHKPTHVGPVRLR
jgi:hypothetical protein